MKVSIAMAIYNGEQYIEKQLDSIRSQTYPVDEVVICDDQSTDATVSVVQNYIAKNHLQNWKLQVNEQNEGFIGNFFGSIARTTGDIIFLCDQDDEWKQDKIKKMVQIMQENANILVLNSAVELIDSESKPIPTKIKRGYCNANICAMDVPEGDIVQVDYPYLVRGNVSPGCTMCFRKEIKEQLLSYRSMCVKNDFPHDWFLNILGALDQGTYFLNRVGIGYRIHSNNAIGVDTEEEQSYTKVQSTREERVKIGAFHYTRARLLLDEMPLTEEQKAYTTKYLAFATKRYAFLQTFQLRKLFPVYRYFKMYKENIGTKGMVSDLIYGLHLDGVLRR